VPTHKIWRLNVPGSASSNLFKTILRGIAQPWRVRLHGLASRGGSGTGDGVAAATADAAAASTIAAAAAVAADESPKIVRPPPSCGFELRLRGCAAEDFRALASHSHPAEQRQHADFKHLTNVFAPRWLRDTRVHAEPEPGQRLLTMTMIRDPLAHFMRTFEKKSGGTFMFAPTWRLRNVTVLPDAAVPASEFAAKAFWKWNVFARALAGNFSGDGLILSRHLADNDITEEAARAMNDEVLRPRPRTRRRRTTMRRSGDDAGDNNNTGDDDGSGSSDNGGGGGELQDDDEYTDEGADEDAAAADNEGGSSPLLELAKQRLLGMSFFGLFERLDESMELLAHKMCWDHGALEFRKRTQRTALDALAVAVAVRPTSVSVLGGEPEEDDAAAVAATIERNNAVDRALYAFAARVFDAHLRAMRADRDERGVVCRFLDTGCFVERVAINTNAASAASDGNNMGNGSGGSGAGSGVGGGGGGSGSRRAGNGDRGSNRRGGDTGDSEVKEL
jgi:uncharacterized membrane protein YgcG